MVIGWKSRDRCLREGLNLETSVGLEKDMPAIGAHGEIEKLVVNAKDGVPRADPTEVSRLQARFMPQF